MYKVLATAFVIMILTGCVSSSIQPTKLSRNTILASDQGIVVVHVANNAARLAPLHTKWTAVFAIRIDNAEQKRQAAVDVIKNRNKNRTVDTSNVKWEHDIYTLTPSHIGLSDSQVFMGKMPEGDYLISSLYSFVNNGDQNSWLSMPVFEAAGKFKVVRKQITDLGSLVFQPLEGISHTSDWGMTETTHKAFVTRINEAQPLTNYVLANYPNLTKQLDLTLTNQWIDDNIDQHRKSLAKIVRQFGFSKTDIALPNSSTRVLAGKFGQLRVLNSSKWHTYNLPTNSQLLSAIEDDESLYIGAERGLFFSKNMTSGQSWQSISAVSAQEAIIWLGKTKSTFYALTHNDSKKTLYSFTQPKEKWVKIRQFELKDSDIFPFISSTEHLKIMRKSRILEYIESENDWKQKKGPEITKLGQLHNGILIAHGTTDWNGKPSLLVSLNDGASWKESSRIFKLSDRTAASSLPTKLDNNIFATVGRSKKRGSRIKTALNIMTNDYDGFDNKKAWRKHYPVKPQCTNMLSQLSHDSTLYFLCDLGEVIKTSDFGKTWQVAFDVNTARIKEQYDKLIELVKEQDNKSQNQP